MQERKQATNIKTTEESSKELEKNLWKKSIKGNSQESVQEK